MKITRRGSGANHGYNEIKIDAPTISWNPKSKLVKLYKNSIRDFTGKNTHDYHISLSLEEIAQLIELVGNEAANSNALDVANAFSTSLREVIRIEKCCIGEVGQINDEVKE